MKNKFFFIALYCAVFLGCQKENQLVEPSKSEISSPQGFQKFYRKQDSEYSHPIYIDSANRMISSYLASIKYPDQKNALRSLTFDADTLRSYLSDPSIVTVKFMLAHPLSYINGGDYGVHSGTRSGGLTFIIVGMDHYNNYVFNQNGMVYDNLNPCPSICDNSSVLLSKE